MSDPISGESAVSCALTLAHYSSPQPVDNVTFEDLQQAVDKLALEDRVALWRSCPAPHAPDQLLILDSTLTTSGLRYCPRCLVAFTTDGRAVNAPGRRYER